MYVWALGWNILNKWVYILSHRVSNPTLTCLSLSRISTVCIGILEAMGQMIFFFMMYNLGNHS